MNNLNLALDRTQMDPVSRVLNKEDVAHSFSRAARSYDSAAELQRLVGEQLMTYLPDSLPVEPMNILDIGSGTGVFTRKLADSYPRSRIYAIDIAQGMLDFAKNRNGSSRIGYCCGDAERLPVADAVTDLLFSNLAVQWCPQLGLMLAEAWRVLKPGGRLIFSTLGPSTLYELKSAWRQVDDYVHVNRFVGLDEIRREVQGVGFQCTAVEQRLAMRYSSLRELTHELKAIGAHNVNNGRPGGLTGRRKITRLKAEYEKFRDTDNRLPATYQVYYLSLTKPGNSRAIRDATER